MAYNKSVLANAPTYLQTGSYDARADRKWFSDICSSGVVDGTSFQVTYSGSLLQLNIAAGSAWIKGGNIAEQGTYREYSSGSVSVSCPAADPTNPRIDTVILRVLDNASDTSTFNEARIEIVPGTPTSGATLSNRSGVNPLTSLTDSSLSFIVLAYVLVPAGASVLTNTVTNVFDARTGIRDQYAVKPFYFFNGGNAFSGTSATDMLSNSTSGITIPSGALMAPGDEVEFEVFAAGSPAASVARTNTFSVIINGVAQIGTPALPFNTSIAGPSAIAQMITLRIVVKATQPGANYFNMGYYLKIENTDDNGTAGTADYGTSTVTREWQFASSRTAAFVAAGMNVRLTNAYGAAFTTDVYNAQYVRGYSR